MELKWVGERNTRGLYDHGTLPTGLTAGTTYYVVNASTNTFQVAATVGGAAINTSGSQSGTHTATAGDDNGATARAGGGNCELSRVNGILANTNAITNGPGVTCGTYVGTIRTNASATVDWIAGGLAAGGTAAVLGVWNTYNRVSVMGFIGDTNDGWTYSGGVWRQADGSDNMRVSFLQGLQEDYFHALYNGAGNVTGGIGFVGVGINSTTAPTGQRGCIGNGGQQVESQGSHRAQVLGWNYLQALEKNVTVGVQFVGGGASNWHQASPTTAGFDS